MAVIRVTTVQEFLWESGDTKPTTGVPPGSIGTTINTGEIWVFDGTNWQPDLRLIWALTQVLGG